MSKEKDNKKTVVRNGIGFPGLLTIAFVVLKLCGVIDWSWWWVFSPVLFSTAAAIIGLIICLFIWFVCTVLQEILK